MSITIEIRDVYGRAQAYPVCETARLFARLRKTTTLTADALRLIHQLGYTIHAQGRYSGSWEAGTALWLGLDAVA